MPMAIPFRAAHSSGARVTSRWRALTPRAFASIRQGRGDITAASAGAKRRRHPSLIFPQTSWWTRHVALPAVRGSPCGAPRHQACRGPYSSCHRVRGLQWRRPHRHLLFVAGWIPQPRARRDVHHDGMGGFALERVLRIEPARWRPPAQGPPGRLEDPFVLATATTRTVLRPHTRSSASGCATREDSIIGFHHGGASADIDADGDHVFVEGPFFLIRWQRLIHERHRAYRRDRCRGDIYGGIG